MLFNKLTIASVAAFAIQSARADTIAGIAGSTDGFAALANMVNLAGLGEALSGDGPLTVFAPVDDAFGALPKDVVTKLSDPKWKPQLQDVLLHHVIDGKVMSADLEEGMTAAMLNGDDVTISLDPPSVKGATNADFSNILVDAGLVDVAADNGVIHAIDGVLTPMSLTSNIVDIAAGNDMFSTLVAAVKAGGLADALMGEGPLTVFAPTNDAFAALPEGTVESLLEPENKDQLVKILQYHVVGANAHSSGLASGDVETLSGDMVAVEVSDGVTVNGANVIKADIIASNGIIHVVDAVLLPPMEDDAEKETEMDTIYGIASSADGFSTLATVVDLAGLGDALSGDGELTVFAPSDDAFAKLPKDLVDKLTNPTWKPQLTDVLLHHVVEGKVLSTDLEEGMTAPTLNTEEVTISLDPPSVKGATNESPCNILVDAGLVDVAASNGVIHGIGSVLTPTSVTSNIVDIAAGNDMFSTLVAAVKAGGLADALMGEGPLTVFAPTNDAFAALPEGTVEDLLKPENKDKLVSILQYHVVAANAHSSGLESGDVPTLMGDSLAVAVSDAGVTVNGANVIKADVIANNGIIHVVDAVLLPPAKEEEKKDMEEKEDMEGEKDMEEEKEESDVEVEEADSGAAGQGMAAAIMAVAAGLALLA